MESVIYVIKEDSTEETIIEAQNFKIKKQNSDVLYNIYRAIQVF